MVASRHPENPLEPGFSATYVPVKEIPVVKSPSMKQISIDGQNEEI